jgi:hypothetical protein
MSNVFIRMAMQQDSPGLTSDAILILIDAFRQREYLKQDVCNTQMLTSNSESQYREIKKRWLPNLVDACDRFEVWSRQHHDDRDKEPIEITRIESGFRELSKIVVIRKKSKNNNNDDDEDDNDEKEEEKDNIQYDLVMQQALLDLDCEHLIRRVLAIPVVEKKNTRSNMLLSRILNASNKLAVAMMGGGNRHAQRVFKESEFESQDDLNSNWCVEQLLDPKRYATLIGIHLFSLFLNSLSFIVITTG